VAAEVAGAAPVGHPNKNPQCLLGIFVYPSWVIEPVAERASFCYNSVMNEYEMPPQNRVELPTPPNEFFGEQTVREGRLGEWLEFARTTFVKIWLKAKAEHFKIRSAILEELTGQPDAVSQEELEQYHKLQQGSVNETAYQESFTLRSYLLHNFNQIRTYLDNASRSDQGKIKLEELTASPEEMLNRILEADLRNTAKFLFDKKKYPDSPYQNIDELVDKMMSMADRNIE